MAAPQVYQPLEGGFMSSIGTGASFKTTDSPSLFTSSSFLWTFAFVVIVVTASFRYAYAGMLRMQATEKGISDSKAEFKRVTYGLLGVFGLWLILFTINKDMLTGNVSLGGLKASLVGGSSGSLAPSLPVTGSGNSSKTCSMGKDEIISAIKAGNVCDSVSCKALSGCKYQSYLNFLRNESGGNPVKLKMLIVVLCKESGGNPNLQNSSNSNGTFDCGLMQVNKPTACSGSDYDPESNIKAGAKILLSIQPRTGGGIPAPASVFAAYNAGPTANQDSVDCNSSNGFEQSVPKWVCPINAGDMCAVKNYACDLNACVDDPSLNDIK